MERNTLQERIRIIKIHYKEGENLAQTVRKIRTFLGGHETPCRTEIKKLVEKIELLGQVSDVKNETHARRSRTAENNAAVAESVEENPGLSFPPEAIPQTSLHRILNKYLSVQAYKVQLTQELKSADLLREKFQKRVISRRGDHNWPPRSCDLTPCDFWGHVKEKVYANSRASIQDLKDGTREAIEDIGKPLYLLMKMNRSLFI